MKKIFTAFTFLILLGVTYSQQASDYFPPQTGFDWKFKAIPLDSASNPIPSLAFYRMDYFESVANYEGKLANIVLTKDGPLQFIQQQPFLDTLFYHSDGTNGYEYFSIRNIEGFLLALDSLQIDTTFSFYEFFSSLQDWYSIYRFASPVNTEYILTSVNQVININSVPNTFRFRYVGKRLQDETIQTVLGNYDCKKFLIQWQIAYLFGPIPIDLLATIDTVWIAPGNWIVQDIIPGQYIDNLTFLGIPPFTIPGLETKLTNEIVVSVANEETIPNTFSLEQNYPNPFNPTTNIGFRISDRGFVSLKVFDVLGNEVTTLVKEELEAGTYEFEFNSHSGLPSGEVRNLTSGVYFYQLQAGSFIETKKMLLLK
jgi:hypothetical protein